MISLNDVLLAMSNIPVDDPIAEIWGRGLQSGYKIIEYTGTFPITITANGDALIDYRIYGASGGVGEPTENLFDISSATANKYVNPATGVETSFYDGAYMLSDYIDVSDVDTITISSTIGDTRHSTGAHLNLYDTNKNWIRGYNMYVANPPHSKKSFTADVSDVSYVRVDYSTQYLLQNSLVKGSTAPANYIPYGYKLPMTVSVNYEYVFTGNESFSNSYNRYQFSLPKAAIKKSNASNTSCSHFPYGTGLSDFGTFSFEIGRFAYFGIRNEYPTIPDFKQFLTDQYNAGTPMRLKYFLAPSDVPVYIGDTQLEEGEYVSYGEQKIYRDVDGTLTPTDPPVPLPQIPTIDGTTIIDYDGDPKPSQMYVKYKGKG